MIDVAIDPFITEKSLIFRRQWRDRLIILIELIEEVCATNTPIRSNDLLITMDHRKSKNALRHVPSGECTRCGAQVDPDQRMFVLEDETPVDEAEPVESGNLCEGCFEDAREFLQIGES